MKKNLKQKRTMVTNIVSGCTCKESNIKFTTVFNNVPLPMAISSIKDGIYYDVNDAFVKHLGYSKKEVIGKSVKDLKIYVNPRERTEALRLYKKNGELSGFEVHARHKNGNFLTLLFSINGITIAGKKYILTEALDITDRKKVDDELRKTKDNIQNIVEQRTDELKKQDIFFNSIVENIPNMIFVKDAKDLSFKLINQAGEILLGQKKKDLIGKSDYDFFPKKQADFFINKDRQVLKTGNVLDIPVEPITTKQGQRYLHTKKIPLFDENGKPAFLLGISEDITERKKIEDQLKDYTEGKLKESEEKFRLIFESSPFGMHVFELTPAGKLIFINANKSADKILGINHKELFGKQILKAFPDLKKSDVPDKYKEVILTGKAWHNSQIGYEDSRITGIFDVYAFRISSKVVVVSFLDVTNDLRAKKKLEEGEARFRAILDSAFHFTGLMDLSGYLIYANKTALKFSGLTIEEATNKPFWETRWWKGDRARVKQLKKAINEVKKGKAVRYEVELQGKGDTKAIMDFSLRPVVDEMGKVIMIVPEASDITERKKTEQVLVADEERFRAIFENSPLAIVLVGLDGKFIKANLSAIKLWGYSETELNKLTFINITHPDEKKRDNEEIKRLVSGKISHYDIEKRYIKKNKEIIFARTKVALIRDENRQPLYFITTIEDITEHKKYEEQIEKSEIKYSNLVESSVDGVIVIQDGKIKFVNKSLEKMGHYNAGEVLNGNFLDLVAPESRKMVADIYTRRMRGEKVVNRYGFDILIKNDGFLSVEVNTSIIDYEGRPAAMAVIRDVSQAKQIDKIKSEFISVASHQLRSPLTGIKWFSQLLVDQKVGQLTEKQIDFIQQIYDSNERMIRLVNDLLDVSHIETGQKFSIEKKPGNIINLINNVIAEQKISSPKKNIAIELDKSCPGKFIFNFDGNKIYQVFSNLINNSIKYSAQNSKVIIGMYCTKNEVQFYVKDFGFGIPGNQKDRIFQKFFRADNIATISTDGTGLGLYIAKSIIEAHGGKIWFDSKQNKGTTFYFTLPIKDKKDKQIL